MDLDFWIVIGTLILGRWHTKQFPNGRDFASGKLKIKHKIVKDQWTFHTHYTRTQFLGQKLSVKEKKNILTLSAYITIQWKWNEKVYISFVLSCKERKKTKDLLVKVIVKCPSVREFVAIFNWQIERKMQKKKRKNTKKKKKKKIEDKQKIFHSKCVHETWTTWTIYKVRGHIVVATFTIHTM